MSQNAIFTWMHIILPHIRLLWSSLAHPCWSSLLQPRWVFFRFLAKFKMSKVIWCSYITGEIYSTLLLTIHAVDLGGTLKNRVLFMENYTRIICIGSTFKGWTVIYQSTSNFHGNICLGVKRRDFNIVIVMVNRGIFCYYAFSDCPYSVSLCYGTLWIKRDLDDSSVGSLLWVSVTFFHDA